MSRISIALCILLTSLCSCTSPANNGASKNSIERENLAPKPIEVNPDSTEGNTVTQDQLISPGIGIGHVLIGEDQANDIKQLGKPDFSDAAMGSSLATWYSNHDSTSYQTSIFSGRNFGAKDENIARIKKILVTSPWFKTSENLGVGTTLEAIKESFRLELTYTNEQHNNLKTFTDKSKGISFEIDTADKCVSVIVHLPNEAAGTYLDMHQK